MVLLTSNRAHYASDGDGDGERYYQRDCATYRRQLIAYLRCLNAYRRMRALLLIREQLPTNLRTQHAYVSALAYYSRTIAQLPSWCAPPSSIAEGV